MKNIHLSTKDITLELQLHSLNYQPLRDSNATVEWARGTKKVPTKELKLTISQTNYPINERFQIQTSLTFDKSQLKYEPKHSKLILMEDKGTILGSCDLDIASFATPDNLSIQKQLDSKAHLNVLIKMKQLDFVNKSEESSEYRELQQSYEQQLLELNQETDALKQQLQQVKDQKDQSQQTSQTKIDQANHAVALKTAKIQEMKEQLQSLNESLNERQSLIKNLSDSQDQSQQSKEDKAKFQLQQQALLEQKQENVNQLNNQIQSLKKELEQQNLLEKELQQKKTQIINERKQQNSKNLSYREEINRMKKEMEEIKLKEQDRYDFDEFL